MPVIVGEVETEQDGEVQDGVIDDIVEAAVDSRQRGAFLFERC